MQVQFHVANVLWGRWVSSGYCGLVRVTFWLEVKEFGVVMPEKTKRLLLVEGPFFNNNGIPGLDNDK